MNSLSKGSTKAAGSALLEIFPEAGAPQAASAT
jgi:hypothetical protein